MDMAEAMPIGPGAVELLATSHILYSWNYAGLPNEGVFQYSGVPNEWRQIADGGEFTYVRSNHHDLYGLKPDGSVWVYGGSGTTWKEIGNGFFNISAGGDGLIGLSGQAGKPVDGPMSFYDWETASWTSLGGNASWAVTDGTRHVASPSAGGLLLYDHASAAWVPIGSEQIDPKLVGGQLIASVSGQDGWPTRYLGSPNTWDVWYQGYYNSQNIADIDGDWVVIPGVPNGTQPTVTLASARISGSSPQWEQFYSGSESLVTVAATTRQLFAASNSHTFAVDPPRPTPPVSRPPRANTTTWTMMVTTGKEVFSGYDGQLTYNLRFPEGIEPGRIPKSHFERGDVFFFDIPLDAKYTTLQSVSMFGTMNYFGDQWHLGEMSMFNPASSTLYEYEVNKEIGNGARFLTELGPPTKILATSCPPGTAEIYIWKYLGLKVAMGHASMSLQDDDTHISWWPSTTRDAKALPALIGWPSDLYCADPFPNQTLHDDKVFEAEDGDPPKDPDYIIRVGGLDNDAIRTWWATFKTTHQWCTLSPNCSTTVAEALWAGGAKNRLTATQYAWYSAPSFPWTPASIYRFVQDINSN